MTELELLQAYWWLIIAVLGAALVFLLFVQGGQSLLCGVKDNAYRQLMINSLGRKWELTFTTLVVFGGAFFASFPLFYSTSFGGAYWLWMLILLSFVVQAVSYEFRRKRGNLYGTATYDSFLMFNGLFGCVLLGVAVGMMFFGAAFTVTKTNILEPGAPVISQWAPSRGLEAIICWKNLLLGVAVFFLARTQAALYFINNIHADDTFTKRMRTNTLINGGIFAVLFVAFLIVMLVESGVKQQANGSFITVDYIYWKNLISMWPLAILLVIGVVMVLYAIIRSAFSTTFEKGIWFSGIGTVLVVIVLFLLAGYEDTAYYRSTLDTASSLTIANSSSSIFTLKVMSYVSILVPFVLAYIWYVWRKMNSSKLSASELEKESHQY
ncbi:MAG: cytochrome d ubiquinol oxidase subunit II [Muribaculaceae bacterium]|nr:cytochrome d ubiquinol oxidase subunit II [Muribaculaceae bacterium]